MHTQPWLAYVDCWFQGVQFTYRYLTRRFYFSLVHSSKQIYCGRFGWCNQTQMLHWHVGIIFNNYSTSARWIWVGYNHLISNKHEWHNCFIKNTPKYREFFLTLLIVKTTNFQLVFNFEQTCTVTTFGERGIIAHIPWWLTQSEL